MERDSLQSAKGTAMPTHITKYGLKIVQTAALLAIAGGVFGIEGHLTGHAASYVISIAALVGALAFSTHFIVYLWKRPDTVISKTLYPKWGQ